MGVFSHADAAMLALQLQQAEQDIFLKDRNKIL